MQSRGLALADCCETDMDIEILIGADSFWQIIEGSSFEKIDKTITCVPTLFGYALQGNQGEGSVVLTGVIRPQDEDCVVSAPSSFTNIGSYASDTQSELVSESGACRYTVSENNLKTNSSLGNLHTFTHPKSASTSNIVKGKIMAPGKEKDNTRKNIFTSYTFASYSR
ncbi:hypothetical protein JTE90_028973 [Oedothorax gibbosus]|uniref:Peptidase aspartic putative domain-containing protein n=1 Tax=Oedothorax gibbosus TaxID=931172 RepID=A0AAV6VGV7_9ARAC|nr:hypothetical protein JTE90_028973 [Oedothorax gibbosus]